jgi:hypothetical protein
MKNLIKLSLVLFPLFANASTIEYKGNDTIVSTIDQSDDLSLIKESISKALLEKFGYVLTSDSGMDNGCYNYLESYISKKEKSPVKGQGYLHDLYSMDSSPLEFSPQYFANGIIETIEEPEFVKYFELFHPTKFWVTSKKVGDRYYLIISLN